MTHNRNVYLNMKSLEEAKQILLHRFSDFTHSQVETIPVTESVGRVLAEPVFSEISSPNFHAAAMDGIAVAAKTTFGAHEAGPKTFTIGTEAFYVNTGHVMPTHTNAVIMIENVQILENQQVRIEAPAFPWQYVRKTGEDIVATELLFPRHHQITPYSIGALLSAGVFSVSVIKRPSILIIPTGSELVVPRQYAVDSLKPGQVIETNSYVLAGLAEACGGTYVRHPHIMDDENKIAMAVKKAVSQDYDVVLVLGGSSAGSEDYAKTVIARLGEVLVHGVTIMPGKPVVIGAVNGKPVFGIPGYPVSAIIAFDQFVQPLLYKMQGLLEAERQTTQVYPTRNMTSKLGTEEFIRVKLGKVQDRIVATQLPRGAGSITSLTEADGIIRIPSHLEGILENKPVTAELLKPLSTLGHTIVCVGSHDNTLDVLADHIRMTYDHITLSSSHVGSMGGLMAIKKGSAHIAGVHLLDPKTNSYNISYIQRYLPDMPVLLMNLAFRDQGLLIPKNNPKQIKGIEDLVRDDLRFINRQGGSGTRILLDHRLSQLGISPTAIKGYEDDEFTHMAVAVAVLSGTADTWLGIFAAAKALDLDFIPVVTEEYDLIIPLEHFDSEPIQKLIKTIRSVSFKDRIQALGGYHTQSTGEILWRQTTTTP